MRKIGYIWSLLAALAWIITVVIFSAIILFPQVRPMSIPDYGSSVFQFFLDFGPIGLAILIVLNGLSGRFAPEEVRKVDLWATRIAWLVMMVLCFIVFVVGWGRDGLNKDAINLLIATAGFSIYDYFVNQGEDWRSRQIAAAAHTPAPAAPAHAPNGVYEIDISDNSAARIGARIGKWMQENPMGS